MSVVLDASSILAFVQDESGADLVEAALAANASCGAANWSEVAQKILKSNRDWEIVQALLMSYDLQIEPVLAGDAEWAARRWKRGEDLSLADRLCMALGERLDTEILTADSSWGTNDRVSQIR
ncbi:MAG: PIN domain-containing protein [Acidimicrobiales bacterium]